MSDTMRLAAIDIGTVTTRLLVADVGPGSIVEVERSTDITHLGEDLSATGRLAEGAMSRVTGCMSRYVRLMREFGVEEYRAVATSASRDAGNGDEFLRLMGEAGVDPRIIDGATEARLAFVGATEQREGEGLLVVDCGGGSTELVFGDVSLDEAGGRAHRIVASRSVDVGSRRMTELFLRSDPPSRAEVEAARAWAAMELRAFFDRLAERPREMLALAGTATSLAAIRLELAEYDASRVHGLEIGGSELSDILELLSRMPLERRRKVVGLHPERAGVIVAGSLILEVVLALSGLDRFTVSEHDILYGILRDTYRDLRESDRGA